MTVDDAIIDLEVKVAFQEKAIAELDEVVRGLRNEIDALRAEVGRLADHAQNAGAPTPDEKPPHY